MQTLHQVYFKLEIGYAVLWKSIRLLSFDKVWLMIGFAIWQVWPKKWMPIYFPLWIGWTALNLWGFDQFAKPFWIHVTPAIAYSKRTFHTKNYKCFLPFQHVDLENSFLCGYLKIKGLTNEYPTLTTYFDGEIISKKHPFLTRKWEADEDVDKKHWVRPNHRPRNWLNNWLVGKLAWPRNPDLMGFSRESFNFALTGGPSCRREYVKISMDPHVIRTTYSVYQKTTAANSDSQGQVRHCKFTAHVEKIKKNIRPLILVNY